MSQFQSSAPIRAAKIGYIVISVLLALAGLLLIIFPGFFTSLIGTLTGIMMILFGIIKLTGYFSKDLYRLAFQYDLAFGILLIALGIIILCRPGRVLSFICILLGVSIFTDSLFKIQMSIDARRFGIQKWWLIFIIAVAAGIAGILLIARPVQSSRYLMILIGISLLAEGILSLSTVLTAVKIISHQKKDSLF